MKITKMRAKIEKKMNVNEGESSQGNKSETEGDFYLGIGMVWRWPIKKDMLKITNIRVRM